MFSKICVVLRMQIRLHSFNSQFAIRDIGGISDEKVKKYYRIRDPRCLKMKRRKMLLLSSSVTSVNSNYLNYAQTEITEFLKTCHVIKVLFIPYALPDYDLYENKVRPTFNQFGFEFESIHHYKNAEKALLEANGIYVGGGNTFLLLKKLYELNLIKPIRSLVLIHGVPYLGSSAGTNVATINICTTNDMPIVYPPSLDALNLLPFNINPHYFEMRKGSHPHMAETRDERIKQYLELPGSPPVVGLREGAILKVEGNSIRLLGVNGARIFKARSRSFDYASGEDISFLMKTQSVITQHRDYL